MATVLIVDDNPDHREVLKIHLGGTSHRLLEAVDGEEALRLCQTRRPDLAILDAMMPKKSGWEVCQILKADPATRSIRVIMLTASLDKPAMAHSKADGHLEKPWDKDILLGMIDRLLAKK